MNRRNTAGNGLWIRAGNMLKNIPLKWVYGILMVIWPITNIITGSVWYCSCGCLPSWWIVWWPYFVKGLCKLAYNYITIYNLFHLNLFNLKYFNVSLVRVQKRIATGLDVLQFFTTRSWDFKSNNFRELYKILTAEEKKM